MSRAPEKPRSSTLARFSERDRNLIVFFFLAALSLLLRLPRLNQGLWYDEIVSTMFFFRAPWKDLFTQMPMPNHHPLYSLLGKLMLMVFGEREWALRLPALCFGVFTPPLLFLFGARWVSWRAGLLSGLIMSMAKWPVWFSQDARGYSAMIFLSLLSTHLFLLLSERRSRGRLAVYILASAAAIYSHFYAGAVVGSHIIIAGMIGLNKDSRLRGRWLLGAGLTALVVSLALYVPLLPDFYRYTTTAGIVTTSREMDSDFIGRIFIAWAAGRNRNLLSLVLLVPALIGVIVGVKKSPLVLWSWGLSLLIGIVTPLALGTFVFDRFFSYALPGFYLMAAIGIDEASRRLRKWKDPAFALGALLMLLMLLPGLASYYRYDKQGVRSACQWIQENVPDYRVQAVGLVAEVYYFYDHRGPGVINLLPGGEYIDQENLDHTAVVISHPWSVYEEDYELLKKRCQPPRVWPSSGYPEYEVRVYVCD